MSHLSGNYSAYSEDVAGVMRAFGDGEPLKETILLVEQIVIEQMRAITNEALYKAQQRCENSFPIQRDYELLMIKNPVKIKKLRKFLHKLKLIKQSQNKSFISFASNIEQNSDSDDDELDVKYDEEETRRMFRSDQISKILNPQQYKDYAEMRKISFLCHDKSSKTRLVNWLQISTDAIKGQNCLDIISFLIRETIATIVDYAILTRLNSSNRLIDPYNRIKTGPYSVMYHPEVSYGRAQDGIKSITVKEINEAMRRHSEISYRKMGMHRCLNPFKMPLLAL